MTTTVDELRDEIRDAVGRFQRVESTAFTKEDLAAICAAVEYDIDTTGRLPSKSQMRAGILWKIGELDEPTPDCDRAAHAFRKAELETIAGTLQHE